MNIYISETGIFGSASKYAISSESSVERISALARTDRDTESVVRDAQQAYVAENTPAYNISISSQGRAAINSLNKLADIFKQQQTSLNEDSDSQSTVSSLNSDDTSVYAGEASDTEATSGTSLWDNQSSAVEDTEDEETSSSSSANTQNLARYSEFQLQKLVTDGSITRTEMNDELDKRTSSASDSSAAMVMRNAIAAYNYQMSYGLNMALTQS